MSMDRRFPTVNDPSVDMATELEAYSGMPRADSTRNPPFELEFELGSEDPVVIHALDGEDE